MVPLAAVTMVTLTDLSGATSTTPSLTSGTAVTVQPSGATTRKVCFSTGAARAVAHRASSRRQDRRICFMLLLLSDEKRGRNAACQAAVPHPCPARITRGCR